MQIIPPQDRDSRPDGALLLTLLRKLAYNAPEAVVTLTHLEAQWSAERFDPDWLAKIGVEALPASPSASSGQALLAVAVEDFKRLCQSAHQFEALGLRIAVAGKPDFLLAVKDAGHWELEGPPEAEAVLKELGAQISA
jgi:hypothetical protein